MEPSLNPQQKNQNTKISVLFQLSTKTNLFIVIFLFLLIDYAGLTIIYSERIMPILFLLEALVFIPMAFTYFKKRKYTSPQTSSSHDDPNNKIKKINKVFNLVNLGLVFLLIILITTYLSNTCFELGCLSVTFFWIFGVPIILLIFFLTTKLGGTLSRKEFAASFKDIFKLGSTKVYGVIALILIVLNLWCAYAIYQNSVEVAQKLEAAKLRQQEHGKTHPWESRDAQRAKDKTLMVEEIISFKQKYGKYPKNLEELKSSNYKVPVDPLTKDQYIYFFDEKHGNFIFCVNSEQGSMEFNNEKYFDCNKNGNNTGNIAASSIRYELNYGATNLICRCNDKKYPSNPPGYHYLCINIDCSSYPEQVKACDDYCKDQGSTNSNIPPTCSTNNHPFDCTRNSY